MMMQEQTSNIVQLLMWTWHEWKLFFGHSVSFSTDSAHVIGGVLIQLTAAFLLRKPLSSWWPWFVVLVFALINEFIDLWVEKWPEPAMQYGEGFKDLLLTMLLPTVLLLSVRIFPSLYLPAKGRGA
jgi:hypothetical protein